MATSKPMVKAVAKNLKYYCEVKRLEDGFDLSGPSVPVLDHPPKKARPTLQYAGLHDRSLKHYFSQPEVRVRLTQLGLADSKPSNPHELNIKRSLTKDMKKHHFLKSAVPECYRLSYSTGPKSHPSVVGYGSSPKSQKKKSLKGGWPMLRSVPAVNIPTEESERLVNSASRLLAVTTNWELVERLDRPESACTKKVGEKPQSASSKRRPLTAKYTWDRNGHRLPSTVVKAFDDTYLARLPRRTYLQRPWSSPAKKSAHVHSRPSSPPHKASTAGREQRQHSAKGKPRTFSSAPERQRMEKKQTATSTSLDDEIAYHTGSKVHEDSDDEIKDQKKGPKSEYQVFVRTSNCIGASTTAAIMLTIYGEEGHTPRIHLATSKYNKVKFQRGKEDLFIVKAHHVGKIEKITIGHDRPQLNYAWHLDKVTIHDMRDRKVFNIPCGQWLSGQDEDQLTYRTLPVLSHHNLKTDKVSARARRSAQRQESLDESHSVDTEVSSAVHSRSLTDTYTNQRSVKSSPVPRSETHSVDCGKIPEKTTMHSEKKGSQRGKDKVESGRGKDKKPQPLVQEYLAGYKAGLEAVEASERKRKEEEKKQDQRLLSGPSIHDACRKGDLNRVKVLMHKFLEMKDLKDENGWMPLHLAAGAGHVDIIKTLIFAGCDDLNVETPTGYTPTHLAAMNGHSGAVMVLNAMGADLGCQTVDQQSPLHLAARAGHLECVKFLVANRAELNEVDSFGRTPLDLAEEYGQTVIADFLRDCERDLSDPHSSLAQMRRAQQKGRSVVTSFEDDKGNSDSGFIPMESSSGGVDHRARLKQDQLLQEKRQIYEMQHRLMEEEGVSFLDSIRQDFEREA